MTRPAVRLPVNRPGERSGTPVKTEKQQVPANQWATHYAWPIMNEMDLVMAPVAAALALEVAALARVAAALVVAGPAPVPVNT